MSTSDGQVTNAVYGFTSMLAIVLASRPEFAVAAFDVGAPTFRSKEYVEYKAGRRAMPDDLRPQIEKVRDVLTAFTIPIYSVPGFEADDLIGVGRRMATIVRAVPVELELEAARWTRFDYDHVRDVFDRFEFRQLLSRFPPPDQVPVQPSLAFEPAPQPAGLKIVEEAAEA